MMNTSVLSVVLAVSSASLENEDQVRKKQRKA